MCRNIKMTTVSIGQGKLRGGKSQTESGFEYYEFLGIPYAKPPVGELRFKSPQSPEPWDGDRDATTVSKDNTSPQFDVISGQVMGNEDCLYLNVYTPKVPDKKSELLPVIVYIHGGGFVFGNGVIKKENGPDFLIEHDVVIVAINYRLSVFGFLSLGIPEAAGNMGLKDQVKALQWIQSNIESFGGDKNNVTLFGVSAGAASVEYLIVSPITKSLFHKAILQSGSCLNHWAVNYEPEELAFQLVEDLGYKGSAQDNTAIYKYLFNAPEKELAGTALYISEKYTSDRLFFGFVPTIENDFGNGDAFITDNPYKLLKRGNFNRVPVIKGFCNKEGYLTSNMRPRAISDILKNQNFIDHWSYDFDVDLKDEYSKKFKQAYTENIQPEDDHDRIAIDFFGDYDFVSGIWLTGKLMAKQGVPVWLYEFSYEGKINMSQYLFGKRKGAGHADDGNYVLCNEIAKTACGHDLTLRNAICKMWTDFARSSSPLPESNVDNFVEWPMYTENNPSYLNIDNEINVKSDYEPNKMAMFENIYEIYGK